MFRFLTSIFIVLLFFGCSGHKIKNFNAYKSVKVNNIDENEVKPVKKNIVFLPLDIDIEYAKKHGIGNDILGGIEIELTKRKYGKVEDRNLITKLKDEIIMHEMSGKEVNIPIDLADYIITGKITHAGFAQESAISVSGLVIDLATKSNNINAAQLNKSVVEISGIIKVIELPSMKTVSEVACEERGINTFKVGALVNISPNDDVKARGEAIKKCLDKVLPKIFDLTKPYGTVVDKMINNNDAIFKINIGSEYGVKEGDTLDIFRTYEDGSRKKVNTKKIFISNIIGSDYAMIVVNKKDYMRIKLGDVSVINTTYKAKAGIDTCIGMVCI